jgi:hypothetical protein
MINPYAVMYDATMDVYRYQDATDTEGFNSSEEKCVASGIKCRYSISGQSLTGSPVPSLQASNQLFCGLETDILEGDKAVVTLRNGQRIKLRVGEVHPYSFQYQCRVERDEKA